MTTQTAFDPNDTKVLAGVQTAVSGTAETRFIQTTIDYYNDCIAARGPQGFPQEQCLLLVYADSPDLDPGLPVSGNCDVRRRSATHTFCEGAASTTENLFRLRQLKTAFVDIDDALQFIEQHLDPKRTFALLLFGQSRALVHQSGVDIAAWVNKPDVYKIQRLDPLLATPALIEAQLDDFHKDSLQFLPGRTARHLWDFKQLTPTLMPEAELKVQSALMEHLKGIYKYTVASVDEEIPNNGGRVDIRISRPNQTSNGRVVTMVELKVLYPYKSDNANEAWGLEGIEQARLYKDANLDTDAAFACIYDARPNKTSSLPKLLPEATKVGVVLKHHLMDTPPIKTPKAPKTPVASSVAKKAAAKKAPAKKAIVRKPAAKKAAPKSSTKGRPAA